ncbi:MAG: hypothetical protein KF775_11765 [Cyclobacteriaceae bacterium]|nr:hypothetical protein [Cyclobacteriaceae bacterium]
MFNTISWEQFLTTAGLLIGGYYLITTVLFYHREIFEWINNRNKPKTSLPETNPSLPNLMGKVQPEPVRPIRKQTVDADEMNFGPATQDEEVSQSPADTKLITGSVADLLQEIKTLAEMVVENNSPQEESIALFKSLLEHYPNVRDSPFREAVTIVIHTTCKDDCHFDIELNEVKQWWHNS